jgi:hypothetical protein
MQCRLILVFKWLVIDQINAETTALVNQSVGDITSNVASDYVWYVMSRAPGYSFVVMILSTDKCEYWFLPYHNHTELMCVFWKFEHNLHQIWCSY